MEKEKLKYKDQLGAKQKEFDEDLIEIKEKIKQFDSYDTISDHKQYLMMCNDTSSRIKEAISKGKTFNT